MTLLSLFVTSTGVFCFVPISQRLAKSGIIPASNSWRFRFFRRLPSVFPPAFCLQNEEEIKSLLVTDKDGHIRLAAEHHQMQRSPLQIAVSLEDRVVDADKTLVENECINGIVSPLDSSPTFSFLPSTSVDISDGHESTNCISFPQDNPLCDSCNILLRGEIPPDHIPSVIRALALFEARERISDVVFNEYEIAALTNAFSMLQL